MNNQLKKRCDELLALDLKFDFNRNMDGGNYIYHGGINIHWTDITCMADDEWIKTIASITTCKKKIDQHLQTIIQNNKTTNTLPFLEINEHPVDLVIDPVGISYFNISGNEIICPPSGGVWLDKILVIASVTENNEQPVYVLSDVEGDELKYFPQNLSPEKLIAETIGYHNAISAKQSA